MIMMDRHALVSLVLGAKKVIIGAFPRAPRFQLNNLNRPMYHIAVQVPHPLVKLHDSEL